MQPDGSQTPSVENDDCGVFSALNAGCPVQAAQTEEEQLSTPFPTYYAIQKCSKDNSWRIAYDVFFVKVRCPPLSIWKSKLIFKQDTGHPYDWEWAIVKFVQNADGLYIRDGVWLEEDGNHPYTNWTNIPSTFDGQLPSFNTAKNSNLTFYLKVMPINSKTSTRIVIIPKRTSGSGNTTWRWFTTMIMRMIVQVLLLKRKIITVMIISFMRVITCSLTQLCPVSSLCSCGCDDLVLMWRYSEL